MVEELEELQDVLQYRFSDVELLERAFMHASVRGQGALSNERLEFLGDAVVGLVISEHLFQAYPQLSEGDMTIIKSAVVSRRALAKVGRKLGLPAFLQVDQGLQQRKQYPASIVCNAYEAAVAAIFLDGGIQSAKDFILRTLAGELDHVRNRGHEPSYKSILQEKTQAEGKGTPRYGVVRYEGPDHQRRYLIVAHVAGEECGGGWGTTKKDAEQAAAKDALEKVYPGWRENGSPDEAAADEAEEA